MNPNDGTAWEGPAERRGAVAFQRPPQGPGVDPNVYNQWEDPNAPREKVERPIDRMLAASPVLKCSKCKFETRSQEALNLHAKTDDLGLMRCERERKKYDDDQKNSSSIDEEKLASAIADKLRPGFELMAAALREIVGVKPDKKALAKKGKSSGSAAVVRGKAGGHRPLSSSQVEQPHQPVADRSVESAKAE